MSIASIENLIKSSGVSVPRGLSGVFTRRGPTRPPRRPPQTSAPRRQSVSTRRRGTMLNLNLYKTMKGGGGEREEYTGHDRFWQPPHERRRRRPAPVRTRSEPQLEPSQALSRTASVEYKATLVSNSLAKLLPCVSPREENKSDR